MIWSVSTAERLRGAAMPVWGGDFSFSGLHSGRCCGRLADRLQVAGAGQRAPHRGGSRHERRDEMRAPALALAALEVSVGCRGAALPGGELVGVHPEAHRAAGEAPLRAEFLEDPV